MKFNKIGVVGAGTMGAGIAQKIASADIPVVMLDIKPELVEKGLANIKTTLDEGGQRKLFTPERISQILNYIKGTTDMDDLKDADLVIEAVFEDDKVKKELFAKLDGICQNNTILASNTSSYKIADLAQVTKRLDRFIGLHYFYHPAKNRLLEIIPGKDTAPQTVETAVEFANVTSKTAIIVKDAPGFAVNRFFVPWLNESVRLLEANVANIPTIDEAAKRTFKIGMGPFLLMNATGIPIAYHSTMTLYREFGKFYTPSELLNKQFASGDKWTIDGKIDESRIPSVGKRLLGVVFLVACNLVEEAVASIEDIDRGAKIGLRWEKGPFELMNQVGLDNARQMVQCIVDKYGLQIPASLAKQGNTPWQFKLVDYNTKDGIATISINRPEAMNALNDDVVHQISDALNRAESDISVKTIVFEGKGKAFIAGADITFFVKKIESKKLDDIVAFTRRGQDLLYRIDKSRKLTIAKINGLALGGGAELALACDVILMSERAMLGFPETGIGIYPGLGGTQRLPRLVGKSFAKYMVFTGDIINSLKAQEIGLAQAVLSAELNSKISELSSAAKGAHQMQATIIISSETVKIKPIFEDDRIKGILDGKLAASADVLEQKLGKRIANKAPIALKLANEIMDKGMGMSLEEGLRLELAHLTEIFSTHDAYEGLNALLQKRRPNYSGK